MATIAMPLAEGFEDSEFTVPYERLKRAGHKLVLIGRQKGAIVRGKRGEATAKIETTGRGLRPESFDALVIPGGHSPDALRLDEDIVDFVRGFMETHKIVGAVCHGPQLLIEADVVGGRTLTSWPSVRKDLINAGASWVDREVVKDGNLITSRKPDDLPAFVGAIEAALEAAGLGPEPGEREEAEAKALQEEDEGWAGRATPSRTRGRAGARQPKRATKRPARSGKKTSSSAAKRSARSSGRGRKSSTTARRSQRAAGRARSSQR
jgi:protease I